MPPTLRKRKAPEPAPAPPAPKKAVAAAAKKAAAPKKATAQKTESAPEKEASAVAAPLPATAKGAKQVAVGDLVSLDDFGGEVETNDGEKTTLKKLVDESKSGVVIFTYPKASTPGCTKQVCFFRDAYETLTANGLAIYGLSADSPKANTAFQTNKKLQYPLLCDPDYTLIDAIGLKKSPKGTQRGVFVISKDGKVLVAEAGSPQGTFDRVKALVEELEK
ncbi:merozoite capping protein-1 [Akanthomyces lecanii RCEF 1005]|uniref:thioredoxin-dependent peroxiredoxin n=1 Tax=Akanthomyces lecanii RCEF 1005 TaxID=1081108 RepID=A0A168JH75_CORDF|nr:merozoite capping protein-1 [Akanthomyces lecanii RCEF 1005]